MICAGMLPVGRFLLCLLMVFIHVSFIGTSSLRSTKFNITLTAPSNTLSSTTVMHKSVHVKHTLSNNDNYWTIVGFEPLIQMHYKAIQQLTVHICNEPVYKSIWYNDETSCNGAQSMLIYEWTPYSSVIPFHLSDGSGFTLNKSKSIVLTIIYRKEKHIHKEQSGVILYISTQSPRFQMGTMYVGNTQRSLRFSCRSSNFPRLLYGVKRLHSNENNIWWRIHIIRVRHFGRKLVQSVLDSSAVSYLNKSDTEIVPPDLFLTRDDYILIECEDNSQASCYFLIYYNYNSKIIQDDNICQNNDYPELFKLIPAREIFNKNHNITNTSSVDGSTIFLSVCLVLLLIWISIIIGCVIMRRVRGLVNFRPESRFPNSSQKDRCFGTRRRSDQSNQRGGDADHILQTDGEHAGHV